MKLVLVDRDGVINDERPGFVKSPAELILLPQALDALAWFTREGFSIAVVTNQSVVGRGIIDEPALLRIHEYMLASVAARGGRIDAVFHCTDHPDEPTFRRKPGAGMLLEALERFDAKAEHTPFIGDAITDMEAGLAAGCPRYLVMTGKGRRTLAALPDHLRPVTSCEDLLDAARRIIGHGLS